METTRDLFNEWLRGPVASKAPSTQRQYALLGAEIPQLFPELKDLRHRSIRAHFKTMKDTPVKANRWKAVVSSFCAYLMEEEYLEANPAQGIRSNPEVPKERALTESELIDLGGGLRIRQLNPATKACIRILLATGCRVSEAVHIEWEELTPLKEGGCEWTIPRERTKANRTLTTLLPQSVYEDLQALSGLGHEGRILRTGPTSIIGADTVRKAVMRLCEVLEIEPFTPHDLRRTVGTILAREGITVDVRKAILNHAPSGVTNAVYNRYDYWQEKKEALAKLDSILRPLGVYDDSI